MTQGALTIVIVGANEAHMYVRIAHGKPYSLDRAGCTG